MTVEPFRDAVPAVDETVYVRFASWFVIEKTIDEKFLDVVDRVGAAGRVSPDTVWLEVPAALDAEAVSDVDELDSIPLTVTVDPERDAVPDVDDTAYVRAAS